jgi:amidophosphoribosyltransferase
MKRFLTKLGMHTKGKNDSELMHMLIKYYLVKKYSLEDAITASFPLFTGAFCLIMMTKDAIAAVRDPYGIRPLSLGKLNGGYVIASETCAFDMVNAQFVREIKPGEMIVIDKTGLRSYQLAPSNLKLDIFEFIYFCRPDSTLLGKSVYKVRENFGRALAKEFKVHADVVMPVPESSIPAAVGFSKESKLPFSFGLVKNRYIGRTFIMPDQHLRDRSVQMKLNPIKEEIKGKRIILIDDSIIRGTTSKKIVKMLRDAGAKTVHLLSSCPPYKFPDFYGIDTPSQKQLIAAHATIPQIKKFIGADSLHYLSYDAMIKATGLPENVFCTSCFTGIYPIDIGKNAKTIKHVKIVVHKETKKSKIKTPALSYEKTRSAFI